jgi:hypothetical protein
VKACLYRKCLAILFVLLIAIPFIQKVNRMFPEHKLHGREVKVPKPTWSWSTILSGKAARDFEAYFAHKVGFRGDVVSAVNQFHFSVFGKLTGNMGTPVVLGEDHWLFEKEYVRHYLERYEFDEEPQQQFVAALKRLQSGLQERNITFILVISPSKPEIYPEHLPKEYQAKAGDLENQNAYSTLRPALDEAGINVLDAHTLFKTLKQTTPFLFAKTGTHWSYYGSFLACREMLKNLNETTTFKSKVPEIESITMGPAVGTDSDLLNILNLLWFDKEESNRIPYPTVAIEPAPMNSRPTVLVVGDSFSFTLLDSLNLSKSIGEMDLLYYFKRHFHYPAKDYAGYMMDHTDAEVGPIHHSTLDWNRLLFSKDLVILEVNEIKLTKMSWGFVWRALEAIENAPALTRP